MFREIRTAFVSFALLTLVTGIAYPLVITAIAQLMMPKAANGSVIKRNGHVIGSALIGQLFSEPRYFWGRPSATTPSPYNAAASAGSNLGPTNPALIEVVATRIEALHTADPGNTLPIPVDLVTASASGLDPDITPAAARYQISRIARLRELSPSALEQLVERHIEPRLFGFLGEPQVNVLRLNLALDELPRSNQLD